MAVPTSPGLAKMCASISILDSVLGQPSQAAVTVFHSHHFKA